ncbi:MAG: DUF6567 family protein [Paludibacteraceae bacterium]
MKKVILGVAAIATLTLASCSTGKYLNTSSNLNMNQTQVVLSEANYKVVKHVQTSVVYKQKVNFDAKQLQQSAYAALVKEANLKGSQALVNVTIEQVNREKAAFLGLGIKKYESALIVSGLVIEFTK